MFANEDLSLIFAGKAKDLSLKCCTVTKNNNKCVAKLHHNGYLYSAIFLAKLLVTVTRDRQYGTGLGHIVKCYTDRNDPIRAESYKAAKASTLLSIMGHWEFCTKALPMIISYYVIVF